MNSDLLNIRQQREALKENLTQLQSTLAGNAKAGLLLADIRDFRRINAAYGFATGDRVLQTVADRLGQLSAPKVTQVFRIGNDEFAIIVPRVMHSELLAVVANRILLSLQAPIIAGEHQLKINVNLGSTVIDAESRNSADKWLSLAERSLAQARNEGIHYAIDPDPDFDSDATDLAFENALHDALVTHSLELYYQPKIDLFSQDAGDFEALIRWSHPTLGFIGPDQFLPVIERMGRFEELTKFVLHTALRHRAEWPVENARVAINVPATMVHERILPQMVNSALNIWGARASMLTLEITEGAIIKDHLTSQYQLARLKALGVRISIDDFGTGYSSLAYFKQLPASELKIDKSFVGNLCNDADDRHLVQLIIDLAHHFGMKVIAEGVENAETLRALIDLNCDGVQGFHFARPMPHKALIEWLDNYQPLRFFNFRE